MGRGTFGIVRLCEHKATGNIFACKSIKKKQGSVPSYDQIQSEINIMKVVSHPNIVQLKEVYESPRKIFMIME